MREILFRGKRADNGEWVYGCYIFRKIWESNVHIIRIDDNGFDSYTEYEVDPETVGQFTGLTDCNGKKIFEGDIIRYADYDEYQHYLESLKHPEEYEGINFENLWTVDEITYGIKIDYPAFDLNKNDFECNGLAELKCAGQWYYEVIGNIHDNPELLKEAEQE